MRSNLTSIRQLLKSFSLQYINFFSLETRTTTFIYRWGCTYTLSIKYANFLWRSPLLTEHFTKAARA